MIIAHRGGPINNPENTMAAFTQAIKDGVDGIEFDIQMSKDGQLIVIHDPTVDRTTNGTGSVGALPYSIIRKLDAGNGEMIPTFKEVLSLGKNKKIKLFAEAKNPSKYPGLEMLMIEELSDIGYTNESVIQSFDPKSVEMFGQVDSTLSLAQLYGQWKFRIKSPQPGNAQTAALMAEMLILNPWMIYNAHRKGFQTVVWFAFFDSTTIFRWIIKLGADGLIVDDYKKLLVILGR